MTPEAQAGPVVFQRMGIPTEQEDWVVRAEQVLLAAVRELVQRRVEMRVLSLLVVRLLVSMAVRAEME